MNGPDRETQEARAAADDAGAAGIIFAIILAGLMVSCSIGTRSAGPAPQGCAPQQESKP